MSHPPHLEVLVTRRPTRAVTAALLIPLALASCGGDEKKDEKAAPSSTTSKDAPSSSTSQASPVSKPSSSSSAAGKGLMDPSPKGAEHLARTYFGRVNAAGRNPSAGSLNSLHEMAIPGCKACASQEKSIRTRHGRGEHFVSDLVKLTKITSSRTGKVVDVMISAHQLAARVNDRTGRRVHQPPFKAFDCLMTAQWTTEGWRVLEIKTVE